MSYILDALKRADAERERGAAPGLHTHHQVPTGSPGTPGAVRNRWLALAAGLGLVLLALFYRVLSAPDQAPAAPVAPTAIAAPDTTALAAPVIAAVPPVTITPMAPAPAAVAEAPKAQPLPPPDSSVKPAKVAIPATAAPAAAPVSQAAPAAPATVPLLSELPQDLRSQIPKITITGSVYSDSPAQRLLLINNLVLSQGNQVGPDLTLEEIQPRSSVFSFKGTRFRVMH